MSPFQACSEKHRLRSKTTITTTIRRSCQSKPRKLRVFKFFPKLPFELRLMVYEYALPPPRFVELQTSDSQKVQSRQFSKSPIPALLHATSETRQTMKALGYKLAFGTELQAPQTWFNFSRDYLYLTDPLKNEKKFTRRFLWDIPDGFNGPFLLHYDMVRVKKVAVSSTLHNMFMGHQESKRPGEVAQMFGNLEEMLIVENFMDQGRLCTERGVNSEYGHVQECLELDFADISGRRTKMHEGTRKYYVDILGYMRTTHSNGKSFFAHTEEVYMNKLAAIRSSAIRLGRRAWNVPDVKLVRMVDRGEVRHVIQRRKRYWARVKAQEKIENRVWLKKWDPFSFYYADDIKAMEEADRRERKRTRGMNGQDFLRSGKK
ncbi:hypothetical protein DL95DRAFT_470963 [Leptodontidium sp. 2 PMI_412]|nr:hypothetical protein DL95DRAFT_470963 [Leptodontidium sp. 2 PMI_412]